MKRRRIREIVAAAASADAREEVCAARAQGFGIDVGGGVYADPTKRGALLLALAMLDVPGASIALRSHADLRDFQLLARREGRPWDDPIIGPLGWRGREGGRSYRSSVLMHLHEQVDLP